MAIFVDENTRLAVQGITGRDGSFHTRQMIEYGTHVVCAESFFLEILIDLLVFPLFVTGLPVLECGPALRGQLNFFMVSIS